MIDEDSKSEIILVTKLLLIISTINFLILVAHMVIFFSDSSAFEGYMSTANVGEPFKFSTVSLESLEAIVGSLKISTPGPDECIKSLDQEIFPDCLKKAKIIPISKARDRKKKQINYNVISLLCSLSKFFEKNCRLQIRNLLKLK